MKQIYTAVIKRSEPWWIGWVEEIPGVNCQERTREKLEVSLRETLIEALEMNKTEARLEAGEDIEELKIAI